ncbi:MAG: Nif3-like dinuclear metal center hexameric protein [Verrucomicrobia bacterium]|nr:Nif3-like dinuclear metal center hexameric protein [Verrucomicrobiota bacterium]
MAELDAIVAFLDQSLRTAEFTDYPGAVNGLQLANHGEVRHVVAAVDASLPVVNAAVTAAAGRPTLLVVHHGMFWQGAQRVTGALYRKLKTAMDADLAIYSSHLPLDVHPQWGNNIRLARAIGIDAPEPFLDGRDGPMGLRGTWQGTRQSLADQLSDVLGNGRVHICPGGPDSITRVGIITGGAGSEVAAVAACGVDTFITGEGPHWSYPLAEELGINLLYAGHYATETFGVKALAEEISRKYGISWEFADHPSGL